MVKRKIDKINKRPVKDDTVKDRLLREQQSYYDRLYYQCQKDLNKQVKVAKTFEIQKLIRKIKELNESNNNKNISNNIKDDDDKQNKNKQNSNNIEKFERKLNEIKTLITLEPIIQECFRRLGIIQINPSFLITQQQNNVSDTTEVVTSNEHDDTLTIDIHDNKDQLTSENSSKMIDFNTNCNDSIPSQTNLSNVEVNDEPSQPHNSSSTSIEAVSAYSSWLYDRILQHKKIQVAIEKWNDQITEYRRWCLRQEERFIDGIRTNTNDKKNNKKSKKDDANKRNNTNNNKPSYQQHNNKPSYQQDEEEDNDNNNISNSMFVKFGNNDNVDDTGSNHMNYYGPESGEEPKKNRTGQRARRAKAIAIQAKKDGTIIDKSLNWRQPKQQNQQEQNTNNSTDHHSSSNHQKVNTSKKQEILHPSWEARKSNQKGIVEFQGKKITF